MDFYGCRSCSLSPETAAEFDAMVAKAVQLAEAIISGEPAEQRGTLCAGSLPQFEGELSVFWFARHGWMPLRDVTAARKMHSKVVDIDPQLHLMRG